MAFFSKKTNLDDPTIPELASAIQDNAIERGSVSLDTSKKSKSKIQKLILALGSLFALILIIFGVMSMSSNDEPEATKEPTAAQPTNRANFSKEMEDLMRQQALAAPPATVVDTSPPPSTAPIEHTAQATQQVNEAPPEPDLDLERRLTGNVIVDVEGSGKSTQNTPSNEQASGRETVLGNRLASRTATPSTVAKNRGDLTYLLRKGTNIACTLDTKIVTTHPGFTRCLVNKDIYSANGQVLLIERGSKIIGEQTTSMLQGQARVFVLWNTVETPNGVTLDIDSPSADSLGASGQVAQVDTHFWERFGGAIMLSLIDDGLVILGDRVNKNSSSVSYDSTSDTIESMAAEALKNTINIPPTGYVNQGQLLNVMVARDVDFKDVYELVDPYLLEGGKRHSLN